MPFKINTDFAEIYKNDAKLSKKKNQITKKVSNSENIFDNNTHSVNLNTNYDPVNKATTFSEKVQRDLNLVGGYMGSLQGSMFILKQEGLQLSNPNLYNKDTNKIFNPTGILSATATGYTGLRPKRHGIELYSGEDYDNYIKNLNNRGKNRLLDLNQEIIKNENSVKGSLIESLSGLTGPNTFFGVGRTDFHLKHPTIKLTDEQLTPYLNVTKDKIENPKNQELGTNIDIPDTNIPLFGSLYENELEIKQKVKDEVNFPKTTDVTGGKLDKYSVLAYDKLEKDVEFTDFRNKLDNPSLTGKGYDYDDNVITKYGMIDAGREIDKSDITKSELFDRINILNESEENDTKDFIKFKIKDINDENRFIIFRSTFTTLNDDISPSWDSENIPGRPDAVHRYTSFERSFSIDFVVPTYSRNELMSNYRRLNELARYTVPKYSVTDPKGFGSPFIRLTLGDYFKDEPGYIDSLNFQVDEDGSWEINLENDESIGQLPHTINVTLSFTVIHKTIPNNSNMNFFSVLDNIT